MRAHPNYTVEDEPNAEWKGIYYIMTVNEFTWYVSFYWCRCLQYLQHKALVQKALVVKYWLLYFLFVCMYHVFEPIQMFVLFVYLFINLIYIHINKIKKVLCLYPLASEKGDCEERVWGATDTVRGD